MVIIPNHLVSSPQVFIGEGWHSIMQDVVNETNRSMIWFFVIYVLVVGILFSQLFIGIIVSTFQASI